MVRGKKQAINIFAMSGLKVAKCGSLRSAAEAAAPVGMTEQNSEAAAPVGMTEQDYEWAARSR